MKSKTEITKEELIHLLESLQTLFSEPARWTQRALARNNRGQACRPVSPEAVCWHLLGATFYLTFGKYASQNLAYALDEALLDSLYEASKKLYLYLGSPGRLFTLDAINDEWGYDVVMKVIAKALEVARA